MKIYSVVIVGCGYICKSHVEDIYWRENIKVVGAVDVDLERAKQFAARYNIPSYGTDYKPYLEREDVDIVIIGTYTDTHLPIMKDCVEHGKHVLCEKPIANTVEKVEEFRQIATSGKAYVLIDLILRRNESYKLIKKMIDEGAIGHPVVFRMAQNHHTVGANWERHKHLLNDCPPIVDCGIHYMDVMEWFTGSKVKSIRGIKSRLNNDIPENQTNYNIVTVKLDDGSSGYYEVVWSPSATQESIKEFLGPKGHIKLVYADSRSESDSRYDLIEYYNYDKDEYQNIDLESKYKPTYEQIKRLIDAIENGNSTNPEVDSACRINKMLLEAYSNEENDFLYFERSESPSCKD